MSLNFITYSWLKKYVDQQTAGLSGVTGGGEWSTEQYYQKGTIVTTNGKVYIAIQDAPAGVEIINEAYWSLLLENSDITDILNLEQAKEGQIPYVNSEGKINWNNIALRRDNDYNYKKIENTFIPVNGEVCLVDVAGYGLRTKIGDGISTFANLPYADESIFNYIFSLIVKGYYYQGEFYNDAEHTQKLEGIIGRIYIDKISGKLYSYDGVEYETSGGKLPNATAEIAGAVKLYDTLGQNTDGTMTQKAITDELNEKIEMDVVEEEEMIVFDFDIN